MDAPDPELVLAWLAGRSLSRGLPAPVADHGGWRVDSGQPEEIRRYLFATPGEGLRTLGEAITEPFVPLKLCGTWAELTRFLPDRWQLVAENWMMVWDAPKACGAVPSGYRMTLETEGATSIVTITDRDGTLAASGHAAELGGVFVFDRIVTEEAHRRRGLGAALIGALLLARRSRASRPILAATPAGRALYQRLGWRDYCFYSTASIPPTR